MAFGPPTPSCAPPWRRRPVLGQDAAAAEFGQWLRAIGLCGRWAAVPPELVLAYVPAHWLPRHRARGAPG